jgi:hypothetical protein
LLFRSKEFGIPLNENDFTNKQVELETKEKNIYNYDHNDFENIPHTSRVWTPIDNENTQYIKEKLEKESNSTNFIVTNIDNIHEISEKNKYFLIHIKLFF